MGYLDMTFPDNPNPITSPEEPGGKLPPTPAGVDKQTPEGGLPASPAGVDKQDVGSAFPPEPPGAITPETPGGALPGVPNPLTPEDVGTALPDQPYGVNPQVPAGGVPTELVTNGDFSNPPVTGGQTFTTGQDAGGWEVEIGDVRIFDGTDTPNVPIDGQSMRLLNENATINQDVTTEVGKQIHITFQLRHAEGDPSMATACSVSAKGSVATVSRTYTTMQVQAALVFTPDSTTTKISFQWPEGVNAAANPVIDNVRIY